MKNHQKTFLRTALLWLLFVVWFASPLPARAALGITGVQPALVANNTSVDLVITGTDFVEGATVVLDGFGALSTTFVSDTVLRAMLPAGLSTGSYTIRVVNPDSSSAFLDQAITIAAPTPTVEAPPEPQPTATTFTRPLLVVESYTPSVGSVTPNQPFDLLIKLRNSGQNSAYNIVATFAQGDFIPQSTGGVLAISEMGPGDKHKLEQTLIAGWDILGKSMAAVNLTVTYTDPGGTSYSDSFTLSVPVTAPSGNWATATPTPTPTAAPVLRPQLVINSYASDVKVLQPGSLFSLSLQVFNVGNTPARRVTMILGGGSNSNPATTPDPSNPSGGVSGGSGDFGNFAPVAASNVQFLGDLAPQGTLPASADLIVNASTNPGAYPMKISFTYLDDANHTYTDDQVITLLVYSLPQVEVNFYRDPGPLFAGQPNQLPIQVVNLGRKSSVLGNMTISGERSQFSNNSTLVGALDPGGYFTLDAVAIPDQPGPLVILVSIGYTDDFNQSQIITRTISVEVQEAPLIEPGTEGGLPGEGGPVLPPTPEPETFWQQVVRFLKGMVGLNSGIPTAVPGEMPPGQPSPGEPSVPAVPRKG